ncbi:hypothetical protein [Chryseobacterium indoltheticum]|uniref:hypothetical protein n=1 Tax=Chryseobacterium indoltheticum TaxID=254 RepID=UPI003F4913F0
MTSKQSKMRYFNCQYIVCGLFIGFGLMSCGSKKYIKEIPYNFSSDSYIKTSDGIKNKIDSQYSKVDDNVEKLSDEQLRLKEKYSIIMEVMPKEVTNYNLYSYIDRWIGTPYKKQSLEEKKVWIVPISCSHFTAMFTEKHFKRRPMEFFVQNRYSFLQEEIF